MNSYKITITNRSFFLGDKAKAFEPSRSTSATSANAISLRIGNLRCLLLEKVSAIYSSPFVKPYTKGAVFYLRLRIYSSVRDLIHSCSYALILVCHLPYRDR